MIVHTHLFRDSLDLIRGCAGRHAEDLIVVDEGGLGDGGKVGALAAAGFAVVAAGGGVVGGGTMAGGVVAAGGVTGWATSGIGVTVTVVGSGGTVAVGLAARASSGVRIVVVIVGGAMAFSMTSVCAGSTAFFISAPAGSGVIPVVARGFSPTRWFSVRVASVPSVSA